MVKRLENYKENWNFKASKEFERFIHKDTCPVAFFSIISLFAEDVNYEIKECYVECNRLFIRGRTNGKDNQLLLRYNYSEENMLVVARVEFVHKRKGNMTKFYEILRKIQQKYHTGPIMIENVSSEEMEAWCFKNKFYEDKIFRNCYWQPKK